MRTDLTHVIVDIETAAALRAEAQRTGQSVAELARLAVAILLPAAFDTDGLPREVTVPEAARIIGVPRPTLDRAVRAGAIPVLRRSGNRRFIILADALAWSSRREP